MQVGEPGLKIGLIVLPCHAVHARGGITLEREERFPKQIDAEMVEERGELLLYSLASQLVAHGRAPVTRFPGPGSGTCYTLPRSSQSPSFAPPAPPPVARPLFVGFVATMTESDFSRSCIIGYGSSPSQYGPRLARTPPWPTVRSPSSRTRSVHTCQGLRPRRVGQALAITRPSVLPSASGKASAPGMRGQFRGSIAWPMPCPCQRFADTLAECLRMTRGRCGSLLLHRSGLAPPTPCQSPGAHRSWHSSSVPAAVV